MVLHESIIEALIEKYVEKNFVLGIGADKKAEQVIKILGLKNEEKELKLKIVPTSIEMAELCHHYKLGIASINREEINLAIEFADMADPDFNYIKTNSFSFVRDKIIAKSAENLIVIVEKKNFKKRLGGKIPFEIACFGAKQTVEHLALFGEAVLRKNKEDAVKTETGHYIVDVSIEENFLLEEIEVESKKIPGVLETGIFIGCADKMLLHNHYIEMKSLNSNIKLEEKERI